MLRVKVSDIVQARRCSKRAKLQALKLKSKESNNAMRTGIALHDKYIRMNCFSFEQEKLIIELSMFGVFERTIGDDIVVRGIPDNFRILDYNGTKLVTIIEVKTTSKPFLFSFEYEVAKFQVQIYAWLLESYLKELGYKLHNRMYVEVYSQKDLHLMKRIAVPVDPNVEKEILEIVDSWFGLAPMHYPKEWQCKSCPKYVKMECDRYQHLRLLH